MGNDVRSLSTSYLLAAMGLVTPFAGLHYFYLRQPIMGLVFLLTGGFCVVGTIVDLVRMPRLVDDENLRERLLRPGPMSPLSLPPPAPLPKPDTPERKLLKAAMKHGGSLTVALASYETTLSLDECRKRLESMAKSGYCQRDVSEEIADLYVFPGLKSNKPFDFDT